jgi:hypothetical protein
MSWRAGELWLDTDVLWFREAPAVAGFAPASIPGFGPPPGLVESRLRRAAWERRRHARRARPTTIALSPAVVFVLAAIRSGGEQRSSVAVEDPPTLTLRLGAGTAGAAPAPVHLRAGHESVRVSRGPPPAAKRKRAHRSVAGADAAPKIEWHHTTSVGLPYGGRLIDGIQLPVEGPNWPPRPFSPEVEPF